MKKQLRRYKKLFINKPKTIDVFGLLMIFFVISLAYLLFNRKVEYLNVTLRLYGAGGSRPRPWYVEQINPGKKQKGSMGRTLIEVVDVYNYEGPSTQQDVYVTLKIRAVQNRIDKQYIYNGSPLLIHDIRSFKVQDVLIVGEIVDLFVNEREREKFIVTFELDPQNMNMSEFSNSSMAMIEGVKNFIAESLNVGMVIKDSKGFELVTIKEINASPGKRTLVSSNGYVEMLDPNRTKVTLILEIVGEKINNYFYYRKEAPLIVGQKIYLIFDEVAMLGTITSVQPISANQ